MFTGTVSDVVNLQQIQSKDLNMIKIVLQIKVKVYNYINSVYVCVCVCVCVCNMYHTHVCNYTML